MRLSHIAALAASISIVTVAQGAEPAKPSKASAPGDKMICKRFTRIGTLAGHYRTCKTKREWDREHANIRSAGQSGYCGPSETASGAGAVTC